VDSGEELRPLSRAGLLQRTYPFTAASLLAVFLFGSNNTGDRLALLGGLGLVGSVVGWIFLPPWSKLPADYQVFPLLWWVGGVAWLNHIVGLEDGMTRPLLLLPILWASIYHKRSHLYLVIFFSAALGVIGGQLFGQDSSWQVSAMPIVVLVPIAFTIQTFAARERRAGRLSEEASLEDPLTGLGNRRSLVMELSRVLLMAQRTGRPHSLMMIDLDHFKAYNDAHGHQAGDALLETVAKAWSRELRATDRLFRYGGEEFIALLPECDEMAALDVAGRMMRAVPHPETCSIGIAVWQEGETSSQLIKRTDVAMYRAKRQGRGQYVAWDESIDGPDS